MTENSGSMSRRDFVRVSAVSGTTFSILGKETALGAGANPTSGRVYIDRHHGPHRRVPWS